MARTRGAAPSAEYSGEGVLLDKDGKPMPTAGKPALTLHPHGAGAPPETPAEPAEPPPPPRYVCNPDTLERSLEAIDLARILAMVFGSWEVEKSEDEWSRLPPDVKRYFRKVVI